MNYRSLLVAIAVVSLLAAEPIWEAKEGFDAPESVAYDPETQMLYVSNVGGSPTEKDGKGWISQLDLDGKVVKAKWIDGLNAPKGIRILGNTLLVSDINYLVAIDIKLGKIAKRIPIEGSKFLNDVAIDEQTGKVYVSDTVANRIYVVSNGKDVAVFAEGDDLEGPNGLLVEGNRLLVASWGKVTNPSTFEAKVPGRLASIDLKSKKITQITPDPLGNLDGLELDGDGYLVSDWKEGRVVQIDAKGKVKTLVKGLKGPADFAHVSGRHLLVVPVMLENRVAAYDLTKVK